MASPQAPPDVDKAALTGALADARDRLHTPESVGMAVVDFLLTEAIEKGTLATDGSKIEVPLTGTITLPERSVRDSSDTGTAKLCITAFGHEIICLEATLHGSHH